MVTLEERFWAKVTMGKPHECWAWGAYQTKDGYGSLKISGATRLAHRTAWELVYGSIPGGLQVLHNCDNPPCCNPLHLFLGNQLENNRDRDAKGRNGYSKRAHCPQGHAYDQVNTRITEVGKRQCIACRREQSREYYRRTGMREPVKVT
jgi:HNH endonuclease